MADHGDQIASFQALTGVDEAVATAWLTRDRYGGSGELQPGIRA